MYTKPVYGTSGINEKDELFQYHYKNHLFGVLHFVTSVNQTSLLVNNERNVHGRNITKVRLYEQ